MPWKCSEPDQLFEQFASLQRSPMYKLNYAHVDSVTLFNLQMLAIVLKTKKVSLNRRRAKLSLSDLSYFFPCIIPLLETLKMTYAPRASDLENEMNVNW